MAEEAIKNKIKYPLKFVSGNYFGLAQYLDRIVWKDSEQKEVVEPFIPDIDKTNVYLVGDSYNYNGRFGNISNKYRMEDISIETVEETVDEEVVTKGLLRYSNNGTLPLGLYDIEITTEQNGKKLRSYQEGIVNIVKTNKEAGIPDDTEFGVDTYLIDSAVCIAVSPIDGKDGVGIESVTTTESSVDGGNNTVTINLTNNISTTFNVKNGTKGADGAQGPQGPQGKQGPQGIQGPQGLAGKDGKDGKDGKNGAAGSDGVTPHIDSTTGNWFIGSRDTLVHAQGPQGPAGTTDYNNLSNKPTIDQTPTSGNTTHLVSSDGIYQYVDTICGSILTRLQGI